jgi:hypothetical protein
MSDIDDDKEYSTTDQGFAAYLAAKKFTFLECQDTGEPAGKGKYGTRKAFVFLVSADEDMDQHLFDYEHCANSSHVPAKVMFNKMRLMRQHAKKLG